MAASIAHVYRYAGSSELADVARGQSISLVTSGGVAPHPYFFEGRLLEPRLTALLLRGVSHVVGSRFHIPAQMLERILAEADPVVTSGAGMLRFEGFSACASAYARVDLSPDAYEATHLANGTTNVDFNAGMRAALAHVRDAETVSLAVGAREVALTRNGDRVVERKVALPLRWLRGFLEVQAYQARMNARLDLEGGEALRFLRSLPRGGTRHAAWVVPAGRGARLSQRESRDGVRVAGTERLRVLEGLAPYAKRLRAYSDDAGEVSGWELDLGWSRFVLALSAEVWRGFSGEGQMLTELAGDPPRCLAEVRADLRWQSRIDATDVAARIGAESSEVLRALAMLGARGLVGFDVAASAYFHRELPFDLDAVESLQPRLVDARKIVAAGGVKLASSSGDATIAFVAGTGVEHRVRLSADGDHCTCTWFSKHQGSRGPCKHVLAVEIATRQADSINAKSESARAR